MPILAFGLASRQAVFCLSLPPALVRERKEKLISFVKGGRH